MRVAIFSDIHGNTIALDAVLREIEADGGVDAFWFVGDAAAMGFDPVGSIQRLMALPNLTAVRGNTDRYTTVEDEARDRAFLGTASGDVDASLKAFKVVLSVAWAAGAVSCAGQYPWLAGLPLEARIDLPDGTRVLLVHAAPGTDDGPGITTGQSDEELGPILKGADAGLVFVGHTHKPLDRSVNDVRVINLGSVSHPGTDDLRAMWTLLEADTGGYWITSRFTDYDRAGMFRLLERVHNPAEGKIRSFYDKT